MKNLFIRYGRTPQEAIVETLRITAIVIFVLAISMFNPIFQLTLLLVPALYTTITYRNGILFSIGSLLVTFAAVFFVSSSVPLSFFLTMMATMGIVVGELYYRQNDMMKAILIGAIVIIANFGLAIYIQNQTSDINFVDYILNSYASMLEESGVDGMMSMSISEIKNILRITLPGIIISIGTVFGTINYFFAGSMVNKLEPSKQSFKKFSEFILPGSTLIAILITILGIGLVELLTGYSTKIMISNLQIVYFVLFFIQGLALIDFMLLRNRPAILRNLVLMVLIFTIFPYPFLVTIGALDMIFNIRRLQR